MGSVYARGSKLWIAFKDGDGKRRCRSSGFEVGQEKQARALLDEIQALVAAGEAAGLTAGPITVTRYAERWIERRRGRIKTVTDEESRLRLHVLPRIGKMALADVRPRHIRDVVLALRDEGKLAPRSVRHVFAVVHRMFRSAVTDDLIDNNPAIVERGVLPQNVTRIPSGAQRLSSPATRSRR